MKKTQDFQVINKGLYTDKAIALRTEYGKMLHELGISGVQAEREDKDTQIAIACGVDYINKVQGGFDGKFNDDIYNGAYFENKNVAITSRNVNCTFNDLPESKLPELEKGVLMTVTVWNYQGSPAYTIVGNSKNVAGLITEKWYHLKRNNSPRKSVVLSINQLINNGFQVVSMDMTPAEALMHVQSKCRTFSGNILAESELQNQVKLQMESEF